MLVFVYVVIHKDSNTRTSFISTLFKAFSLFLYFHLMNYLLVRELHIYVHSYNQADD